MRAFQPLVTAYAARSPTSRPLSSSLTSHRLLHTPPFPRQPAATPTSTPPTATVLPPPPHPHSTATSAAKPEEPTGGLHAARRWLRAQPPVVRGTIVTVFVVLVTLESSFWAYNGYLRWQSHQAAKRREAEEAMERVAETK